jgi:Putative beta-lactamase-inhibitor-like, PepSY-like
MITRVRSYVPVVAAALVVAGATGCSAAPGPVQQAFDQRYPGFEAVTWEQQPYGWEAAFGGDDGAYEAEFDPSGRWLETEVEVVDGAGFPAAVRQAVQGVTGGGPIDKWEIEVTPTGEFYEIEILGSDGEYYFDANGQPVDNEYEDA